MQDNAPVHKCIIYLFEIQNIILDATVSEIDLFTDFANNFFCFRRSFLKINNFNFFILELG